MFNKFFAAAAAAAILGSAASAETVSLTADDQVITDNVVTAERVFAAEPGWLVLHSVVSEGDGTAEVGDVIGQAWLEEGENTNVTIQSATDIEEGERVVLMVYTDNGDKQGEFEFTGDPAKDVPYTVDGNVVMLVVTANNS